ncbi:kinase-like domain-containing protein [Xylaria sp. FL0043]|nr:kinase-like domain-containing protein [Xylaria sp. FL0043]
MHGCGHTNYQATLAFYLWILGTTPRPSLPSNMSSVPLWTILPPGIHKTRFISIGAISFVYRLTDQIVIKYARNPQSGEIERENAIYDMLGRYPPSPYILQSFLRTPIANFLPYIPGGTLDQLLQSNQILESVPDGQRRRPRVVGVRKLEPRRLVERWTAELAAADAWLESLGYAHADLRPTNILLDEAPSGAHLKLTDFDCAERYGRPCGGGGAPWVRLQGTEAGDEAGRWGVLGPRTEQFAIGSIVYCLTRGVEPYHDKGPEVIRLLRNMVFPPLSADEDALDSIIHHCWFGLYPLIADLAETAAALPGAEDMAAATALDATYVAARQEECRQLLRSNLLKMNDG